MDFSASHCRDAVFCQQNNGLSTIITINKAQYSDSLIVLTLRGYSVLSASSLSLVHSNAGDSSLLL